LLKTFCNYSTESSNFGKSAFCDLSLLCLQFFSKSLMSNS